MKKLLKSAMLFMALVLANSLTFAAAKVPEVYISEAPVSELSGHELLNTGWFWALVAVILVVFVIALISTKDQEDTHFPNHAL